MSFSSLPPELVHQIIESTVPHTFHTSTYLDRQDTLCRLSLVSRQFRSIAQPLLLSKFVKVDSATALTKVFKRVSTDRRNSSLRHFGVRLYRSDSVDVDKLAALALVVPSLPSLTIDLASSATLDLSFLTSFRNLSHLQLTSVNFKLPESLVLPNLQSLAISDSSPELRAGLLHPHVLPKLRAFGVDPDSRLEYQWLSEEQAKRLVPQLDALFVHLGSWSELSPSARTAWKDKTLVECYYNQLQFVTEEALEAAPEVVHLRVYGIDDAHVEGEPLDPIIDNVQRLKVSLQATKPSKIKLIYFDRSLENDPSLPLSVRVALDELVVVCAERGVEIVWEDLAHEVSMDFYIMEDFWKRKMKPD
ncbi:hypothetical protein JCM5350_007581 [Sporobolomyces pararoseus]